MLCILGEVSPDFVSSSGSKRSTLLAISAEDTLVGSSSDEKLALMERVTFLYLSHIEKSLPVRGELGEKESDELCG